MVRKTYLHRDSQVNSTVDLLVGEVRQKFTDWRRYCNYDDIRPAFIARPHRLFLLNDLIFVDVWANGQASRWPVLSVSSKGYRIKNFYLQWKSFWQKSGTRPRNCYYDFIELPPYLVDQIPDVADVRFYLIETLRTRDSALR